MSDYDSRPGAAIRDRVVCGICNWLLNHVASPRYRDMIGGSIKLGLATAAGKGGDGRVGATVPARIDPSVIDRDAWRTWAQENLDGVERERMLRALAADEAAE